MRRALEHASLKSNQLTRVTTAVIECCHAFLAAPQLSRQDADGWDERP
jgi:hypothetical protein